MYTKDGTEVRTLKWAAPTENTDGSPITGALTYNLYVDNAHVLSFPGTLNAEGKYEFAIADVSAMNVDAAYILNLTAVDEDGDESDFSNSIEILRVGRPNRPLDFSAV